MAEQTNIYSIGFDSSAFVKGIDEALNELKKFDAGTQQFNDKLQALQGIINRVSFTKPIRDINALRDALIQSAKSFKGIDLSDFNKTIDAILQDSNALRKFLADIREGLKELSDPAEIKRLELVIDGIENQLRVLEGTTTSATASMQEMGTEAASTASELGQTSSALDKVTDSTKEQNEEQEKLSERLQSGRARLRAMREELLRMEDAGLDGTEAYRKLRIEAARLQDQLGDTSEAVRVLSSDTFALDATIDIVKQVAAGYGLLQGALSLTGADNEELQKSMQKMIAVMSIVNGLQELQAFVTGQSAGKLALQAVATNSLAASQRILAATLGASAAASRGLAVALASTGIGALVVLVGVLSVKLLELADSNKEAESATRALNEALERQARDFETETNALEFALTKRAALLKANGASEAALFADRKKAAGEQVELLKTQEAQLRTSLERVNATTKEGVEQAAEINKRITDNLGKQNEVRQRIQLEEIDEQGKANEKARQNAEKRAAQEKANYEKRLALLQEYNKALATLQNRLLELQDVPTTEASIRERSEREFKLEEKELREKYKALGKAKVDAIVKASRDVQALEVKAEVETFKKSQEEARKEIAGLIESNQREVDDLKISFIENGYFRELSEIREQEKRRRDEIIKQGDETRKRIADAEKQGLLTSPEATQARIAAQTEQDQLLLLVADDGRRKRLEAQKRFYEQQLSNIQTFGNLAKSEEERAASEQVLAAASAYAEGALNREQYERRVIEIQRESKKRQLDNEIETNIQLIAELRKRLAIETDEVKKAAINQQIAVAETAINTAKTAIATIDEQLTGVEGFLQRLFNVDAEGAKSIQQSVQSVIQATTSLLREQAQAQVDAADAAVEAQKKRVDEALRIAEAGNAEYLQQEEERLAEAEAKREAAARKQLAIDAALRTSQVLVAVAGAASKIATGNVVDVIAGIAAIAAAIASATTLINQLNAAAPRFAEGTDRVNATQGMDRVNRGRYRAGTDTIPAWLNEGEAVIQADKAEMYRPAIAAMRRGLIPPELVNGIAKHRDISGTIVYDFQAMTQRIGSLEKVMERTADAVERLKVNVSMDADGFSAAITTHMNRRNKIMNA